MKQRWIYAGLVPLALAAMPAAQAAGPHGSPASHAQVLSGGVGSGAREQLAQQARATS